MPNGLATPKALWFFGFGTWSFFIVNFIGVLVCVRSQAQERKVAKLLETLSEDRRKLGDVKFA